MEGGRRKANPAKNATTPEVVGVHVEKILLIINLERNKKMENKELFAKRVYDT